MPRPQRSAAAKVSYTHLLEAESGDEAAAPKKRRKKDDDDEFDQGAQSADSPEDLILTPEEEAPVLPTSRRKPGPQHTKSSVVHKDWHVVSLGRELPFTRARLKPEYSPIVRVCLPPYVTFQRGSQFVIDSVPRPAVTLSPAGYEAANKLVTDAFAGIGPRVIANRAHWKGRRPHATWGGWFVPKVAEDEEKPRVEAQGQASSSQLIRLADSSLCSGFTPLTQREYVAYLPRLAFPSAPEGSTADDELEANQLRVLVGDMQGPNPPTELDLKLFAPHALADVYPGKIGYFFNAGGSISALAWLPASHIPHSEFLAVGTFAPDQTLSGASDSFRSLVQIWCLDTSQHGEFRPGASKMRGQGVRFQTGLCHSFGAALALAWCPRGGPPPSDYPPHVLGLLAGVFSDGTLRLFYVPCTEPGDYVKVTPALTIRLPNSDFCSFQWTSHEQIVAGANDGSISVWKIKDALQTGEAPLPSNVIPLHTSPVSAIAVVQIPPRTPEGDCDLDPEPEYVYTAGYDGRLLRVDIRHGTMPILHSLERAPFVALNFSPFWNKIFYGSLDYSVRSFPIEGHAREEGRRVVYTKANVNAIGLSENHSTVATGSSDGTCYLNSLNQPRVARFRGKDISQKLFRIDYNRETGQYRMIDNIFPEQRDYVSGNPINAKSLVDTFDSYDPNPAWMPHIAVNRLAWHTKMNLSPLLASGLACGIVRLDWCEGI